MSQELIPSQPTTTPAPHAGLTLTPEAPARFWTKARIDCAQLVAEGRLTIDQVAAKIGKSSKWINESKRTPYFKARVNQIRDELAEDAKQYGIADQRIRLARQNDRWNAMHDLIAARAEAMKDDAPGSDTGLLEERVKMSSSRDEVAVEHEYLVDTGLLSEMRALEAQVAKELGQTAEKDSDKGGSSTFVLIRERIIERGQRLEPLG